MIGRPYRVGRTMKINIMTTPFIHGSWFLGDADAMSWDDAELLTPIRRVPRESVSADTSREQWRSSCPAKTVPPPIGILVAELAQVAGVTRVDLERS